MNLMRRLDFRFLFLLLFVIAAAGNARKNSKELSATSEASAIVGEILSPGPLTINDELVEVKRYDPETQTYLLAIVDDPDPRPLNTTPERLANAVAALPLNSIGRKPDSIVGNEYLIDKGLVLLMDSELAQRKKQLRDQGQ